MAKAKLVTPSENSGQVKLAPIQKLRIAMRINGITPLIQHKWAEKALQMIRDKHAGKKTKNREVRDPEAEGIASMYLTAEGKPGAPAMAIKSAIITAAHKDIGVEKTLVKKAAFIICTDPGLILEMDCDEPEIREDAVRVGMGSTDLRYRPYFHRWSVALVWELDGQLLQVEDLLNLIDRAGFGVGIGEWRPEKGGEYGRFEVDRTTPIDILR